VRNALPAKPFFLTLMLLVLSEPVIDVSTRFQEQRCLKTLECSMSLQTLQAMADLSLEGLVASYLFGQRIPLHLNAQFARQSSL